MTHAVIFAGQSMSIVSVKPAGAYIIANVFRRYGFTAAVIDLVFALPEDHLNELIDKFVTTDTRFICLSTTLLGPPGLRGATLEDCDVVFKPIMDRCKAIAPKAIFIIGGSKITRADHTSLPFDYAVIGQGESTLTAIINHELYDDPLVTTLTSNVKYVTDKVYGYGEYNTNRYLEFTEHDGVMPGETLPLEFGRGCVFKCSYCSYDLVGKNFGDFTRSEEVMYQNLMHNYRCFGTTRYMMTDDTINDSLEKVLALQRIVQRLPFKFEFAGYMRLELFQKHPETAQIYRDIGLKGVNFGIETFNKKAGAAVGKGFGEKAKDVLKFLKEVWGDDVHVTANFIIGLPYDSKDDLAAQQEWLETSGIISHVSYSPLIINKHTDSFLANGEYGKYYVEIPLTKQQEARCKVDPRARHFHQTSMNWLSAEMTLEEASEMALRYGERIKNNSKSLFDTLSAFNILPLQQYVTAEKLKSSHQNEVVPIFSEIRIKKLQEYYEAMLKVVIPDAPLPERQTPLVIPHTSVFTSKLTGRHKTTIPIKEQK